VGEPSPTLSDATPVDAERAVAEAEHVAGLLRLRAVIRLGMFLWAVSVGFDVLNARDLAPGSLPALLVLRGLGEVLVVAAWLRLRRRRSPAEVRAFTVGLFAALSGVFGAMGAAASGIASPYFGGAMIVLLIYGAVVSEHWRRGLLDAAATFFAYPAFLLGGALFSPAIAAQLRDPVARAVFSANLGNLFIAYVLVAIAGHFSWRLRRQVFETRSLGRYKLKRRIGAGGMGEVWLAHHKTLKRDVAVKILRVERALADSRAVARFEREVRATTELVHPNTVRVFDYGVTDDGVWFYAMELLHGESVASLVEREGALPPPRAVHLALQAAAALTEAHAKGIVHRDVKPENLFVVDVTGEPDFLKVLDFGIAKVAAAEQGTRLTQTGALVGTPAWLAPEGLLGLEIDARADVYSLGGVLYYMLAGEPPFHSDVPSLPAVQHLRERPDAPSSRRGEAIRADLEAVVMRCLARQREARFASARELVDALEACEDAGRWRRERVAAPADPAQATTQPISPLAATDTKPDTR
jgi:serine/threonine-protein kinase